MDDLNQIMCEMLVEKFADYTNRLNENDRLCFESYEVPQMIISIFFNNKDIILDDSIAINQLFKKLYVTNETFIEGNTKEEKKGTEIMYDFIFNYNTDNLFFEIILLLHQKLFSQVPYPEFGGKYRDVNVLVKDTDFAEVDYRDIQKHVTKWREMFDAIIALSKQENFNIFEYIDRSIELACQIIFIQPFADGNKRTARGLLNLLLKRVDLPMVYIDFYDKENYFLALKKANTENDYTYIHNFYYYRICASMMEYGLKFKVNEKLAEIKPGQMLL